MLKFLFSVEAFLTAFRRLSLCNYGSVIISFLSWHQEKEQEGELNCESAASIYLEVHSLRLPWKCISMILMVSLQET